MILRQACDRQLPVGNIFRTIIRYSWLLCIVAFAVIPVSFPLSGDQALFIIGGRILAEGGVYYRDFQDVKQPGIYYLYSLIAHIPLPPSYALGLVHAGLIVLTAVMVVAIVSRYTSDPWLPRVAAVCATVPYLVGAGSYGVGQIEGMIGLWCLVGVWGCLRAMDGRLWQRFVWSGVSGLGLIMTAAFKLIYVPVVLVVMIAVAVSEKQSRSWAEVKQKLLIVLLGTLWLMLAVAVYGGFIISRGLWQQFYLANWTYPAYISQLPGLHDSGLVKGQLVQAAAQYALVGCAAVVALAVGKIREGFMLGAGLWVCVNVPVIAVQRSSAYQIHALMVPLGIMGAYGICALIGKLSSSGKMARIFSVVTALCLLLPLGWLWTQRIDRQSVYIAQASQSLSAHMADNQSLYVLGNPIYYLELIKSQPLPLNGWSPEFFPPSQWTELAKQLSVYEPNFVYIQAVAEPYIQQQMAAGVRLYIAGHYQIVDTISGPVGGQLWKKVDALP